MYDGTDSLGSRPRTLLSHTSLCITPTVFLAQPIVLACPCLVRVDLHNGEGLVMKMAARAKAECAAGHRQAADRKLATMHLRHKETFEMVTPCSFEVPTICSI